jgi:hypothetical protein
MPINESSPIECLIELIPFLALSLLLNLIFLTVDIHSIRRRALDLLYGMCDVTNAKDIVEELLQVWN